MNFADLKKTYETDGFVVIRGFLPTDELTKLQDNLDRYVREIVPHLPDGDAFYDDKTRPETLKQLNRIQQDPFFAEYLKHPLWQRAAEELLGESVWVHGADGSTNHLALSMPRLRIRITTISA